jgi:predicted acetyltransferase
VSVTVRDARNTSGDREWIRAAYRDYLSELSSSKTGIFPALGEWTTREDEFLAGWFGDPSAHPFVILHSGVRAGFALVSRPASLQRARPDFRMADFFIVRDARRRGVGASAAALLFSRFAGEWEVLEDAYNRAALQFWRRVIGSVTSGRYSESASAGEVRHRFRVDPRPSPRDA